jgi:preprotein translocase subunit SecB
VTGTTRNMSNTQHNKTPHLREVFCCVFILFPYARCVFLNVDNISSTQGGQGCFVCS